MKEAIIFSLIMLTLVGMASYHAFQTTNSLMDIEKERELRLIINIVKSKLGKNDVLDLPSEIQGKPYKIWIENGELYGKCGDTIISIKLDATPDIVFDESSFSGGKLVVEVYEVYGKMHVRFSHA